MIENIQGKEKIINASIEEFAMNGYKGASTNAICKKAKVSKGLLYYHYASKSELYIAVLEEVLETFKNTIHINTANNKKKGVEYISDYFNAKFEFFRENPMYSKIISNIGVASGKCGFTTLRQINPLFSMG